MVQAPRQPIVGAFDAGADDLRIDRTDDPRDFVKRKEVELEAHLARKNSNKL
jgi:hypothetical protein